jgi:CubicO group peptidase (beta-lactamase class C family)
MRVWLLFAVLLAACGSSAHTAKTTPPPAEDATAKALRAGIEPLYEKELLQGGMVVALIEPAKDPVFLGFGRISDDDATPPGADAIFEIGSVSKVLTGLLLRDAVARGEVTLDTPVAQMVPFGVRFPDADGVRPTLGDLVTHRSGLPTLPENLNPADITDPYADFGEAELYTYLEYAQLHAIPGTVYAYSNLGAGLLGFLLARQIGTSYEQAVKTRILSPLGLAETWIEIPKPMAPRLLPGTRVDGQPAGPWRFDVLAGAGAWRSTAKDMAKLVQTAASAAAGEKVPLGDVLRASFEPLGDAGGDMAIATAWHITAKGVIWHNGMTGGYASYIGFDPKTRRGVVVLASSASPLITQIGMETFDAFAGDKYDLQLGLVDVSPKDLDLLVGSYQLADKTVLTIVRDGDDFFLTMEGDRVRLHATSPTTFLAMALSATVEFVVDGATVRGFILHMPDYDVEAVRKETP